MKTRKNIPLGTLRAFEAAAPLGRMTLAADELGVTHGAISRQVRQLQCYLGIDLFQGPRSRPVLTSAGTTLLDTLTPAFDQIDAAVRTVGHIETGVLDVACYGTFAMRWLIPRLHRFQDAHPSIDVRLTTNEQSTQHSRRRFDIEIMLAAGPDDLIPRDASLFPERLGVVVAPALARRKPALRLSNLAGLPQLTTRTRPNAWREWLKLAGVEPPERTSCKPIQFEHYTFTIEAAASGLGACVTPFHLVDNDLATGRLIAPFGFLDSGRTYVARQSQHRSKSSGLFAAWLRREATQLSISPSAQRPR